jgi:hypothetical protein
MIASTSSEIFPGHLDHVDSPIIFDFHYSEQTGGFSFIK